MTENNQPLPKIVGIRFSKIGKNYYFDASKIPEVNIADTIVVETSRGWQIGEVAEIVTDEKVLANASYKPVDHLATAEDLRKKEELQKKSQSALQICNREAKSKNYSGIKVISSEISFDEKIISFLYSSESEDQPNFNQIKKTVGKEFPNVRIDFHKVGPRDIAKYFGGMGACGLEVRCCTKFLNNFESISIRMAKKQGISLTPSDITGMCDRLRCCLNYEYCQYVEAMKNMPKKNKMVMTPRGIGKITDIAPLRNCVYVYIEDFGIKEFEIDEISEETGLIQEKVQVPENKTEKQHRRFKNLKNKNKVVNK